MLEAGRNNGDSQIWESPDEDQVLALRFALGESQASCFIHRIKQKGWAHRNPFQSKGVIFYLTNNYITHTEPLIYHN